MLVGSCCRAAVALLGVTLLAGCPDAPPVTIQDVTADWTSETGQRVLDARVELRSGWVIESVYVRYTRHYWPGAVAAHDKGAEELPDQPGIWRAKPAKATAAPRADHLFYQWFVEYRREDGSDVLTLSTIPEGGAPHDMVIGCSEADIDASFETVRQVLNDLQPAQGSIGDNPAWFAPSHFGPVVLLGQGTAYARAPMSFQGGATSLSQPDLLLYGPRPQADGESDDAYFDAITDFDFDEPYTLLGVAYGSFHADAKRRPSLGCIPSSEWFVHEAGFHTPDGGMLILDVPEDFPGQMAIGAPASPPLWAPVPPFGSMWHPRIWDLHFWRIDGGAGRPVHQINAPEDQPGLDLGSNAFFRSQTFE